MKRSLNELIGYSLQARNGEKGKVKDFLFDDTSWAVQYVEADLGNFFAEKRVLIPRKFLGEPEWEHKRLPVDLTVESIKESPDLSSDMPVSRKYEKALVDYYGVYPYWLMDPATYAVQGAVFYPGSRFKVPQKVIKEAGIDTGLRSFNEVIGYRIEATDDSFGQLTDLIIDDKEWQILHVVIDTKTLVPWSHKVILPIDLLDEFNLIERKLTVKRSKESIKNAPEFNGSDSVNEEYEEELYDYYERKK